MTTPEEQAREVIDAKLSESGWVVQTHGRDVNLIAGPGVLIREFRPPVLCYIRESLRMTS